MTDDELTEAIAGKICDPPRHVHHWPLAGVDAYCGQCWTRAAAVLPIVAVEVRKAKAEALREPALAILMDSFDASVADHLADAGYTEYAEDEDGGLTWVSAPLSEVLLIVRTCATEYETGHQA